MQQPKARILIADDEQDSIQLMKEFLEEEGYEVHSAVEGHLALRLVKTEKPDVLVLDLKLPGLDGERMLEEIWAKELAPQMRVIVLTGFNDFERTKDRILTRYASRVAAYVEKPIDVDTFRKTISDCILQGRPGS